MDTILKNECYFFENQYKSISKKISLVLYCGKYLFFSYLIGFLQGKPVS